VAGVTVWAPVIALGVTLPALLRPDGRLRSRRWRVVAATAIAGPAMFVVSIFLIPGPTSDTPVPFDNPFGQPGLLGQLAKGAALAGLALHVASLLAALLGVTVPLDDLRRAWVDPVVISPCRYALVTALLVVPYLLIVPAAGRLAAGSGSLTVAGAT
jgi:hypothetical protein